MKVSIAALAILLSATPVLAQGTLTFASPIPEGAESRFCYYAGLVYSPHSYILLTGNTAIAQVSGRLDGGAGALSGAAVGTSPGQLSSSREERLMECVAGDDGMLRWVARATMQASR